MYDVYSRSYPLNPNGVELRITDHGPGDGTPVLLVHGWPDSARLWRHQVPALTQAGYRVIAPDLRGFGESGKPAEVEAYRVRESVTDLIGVLDHIGIERTHLVGHDFGATTAWLTAIAHPDRVRSLVALSVGHPNSFNAAGLRQLQLSWYMLLFQFEGVAEEFLSADNWARFRALMGGHPETTGWIESLSRPGALTASLNWYRANSHPRRLIEKTDPLSPSRVPTLGIWSTHDMALSERQMTGSAEQVDAEWEYLRVEDASHWIPLDAPDLLNRTLADWFARH